MTVREKDLQKRIRRGIHQLCFLGFLKDIAVSDHPSVRGKKKKAKKRPIKGTKKGPSSHREKRTNPGENSGPHLLVGGAWRSKSMVLGGVNWGS